MASAQTQTQTRAATRAPRRPPALTTARGLGDTRGTPPPPPQMKMRREGGLQGRGTGYFPMTQTAPARQMPAAPPSGRATACGAAAPPPGAVAGLPAQRVPPPQCKTYLSLIVLIDSFLASSCNCIAIGTSFNSAKKVQVEAEAVLPRRWRRPALYLLLTAICTPLVLPQAEKPMLVLRA